jgi:ATP-binding cassette subfamily B protein
MKRLGEAVTALVDHHHLGSEPGACLDVRPPADAGVDPAKLNQWLEAMGDCLGVEVEPTSIAYSQLPAFLKVVGPAIFPVKQEQETHFLILSGSNSRQCRLLGPDQVIYLVPLSVMCASLCFHWEKPIESELEQLFIEAHIPPRQWQKARTLILRERLSDLYLGGWLLELSPGSSFALQMQRAGIFTQLCAFVGLHSVQYGLWLASWWFLGQGVFRGQLQAGWLWAWVVLLITLILLRSTVTWFRAMIALGIGGLLQKRLLYGALRLHPDEVRHQGVGQMMGRVFEADTVEMLALRGGLTGIMCLIELSMAGGVLASGAGGWFHASLLLIWCLLTAGFGYQFFLLLRRWTVEQRDLTHDLIERMVGHRTLLAQDSPAHWHDGEDEHLYRYLCLTKTLDERVRRYTSLLARGWLLMGLAGLIPAFVAGEIEPGSVAVGLGGVLSAELALRQLRLSMVSSLGAMVSWEQIKPLFTAAGRKRKGFHTPVQATELEPISAGTTLLESHHLKFQYPGRYDQLLQKCQFRILAGDRILLTGPSGSGKSTLVALMTGLREPTGGLLLWQGVDPTTSGTRSWRQRVVSAPQFHENYVLTGTFAFNVLMGRGWPPRSGDMQEAKALCQALGLGELLERMPGGLHQMVGEIGWQLSHGERSRLYIARALLQETELLILDESFAALDPESLQQTVECVLEQSKTLVVVTHF